MALDGNSLGIEALDMALSKVSDLKSADGASQNALVASKGTAVSTFGPKIRSPSPMKPPES